MPIYEYVCEDCGTKFEKLVLRASDKEGLACPKCGKSRLAPQLSTFAAHAGGDSAPAAMPQCPSAGCCPHGGMCGMN
jgi:putative FmdB family regulatory protein